jgi:hypothetical protein
MLPSKSFLTHFHAGPLAKKSLFRRLERRVSGEFFAIIDVFHAYFRKSTDCVVIGRL